MISPIMLYSAKLVLPITAPMIVDGAVAVRGRRILHIGERQWVIAALEQRGAKWQEYHWSGMIIPGLVNAHTHLQYTHMAKVADAKNNIGREYNGMEDWDAAFEKIYKNEKFDWKKSASQGAQLLLKSGTTAAADVVTDVTAINALNEAGLHGITYWEVMGWENDKWNKYGRNQVIDELANIPTIPGAGVSPHAPYTLEVQPLLEVPDIARQAGLRLHIHLAEALLEHGNSETAHPASEKPAWQNLRAPSFVSLKDSGHEVSSTEYVDHLGVLGPDCHIAHGVYVTAEDRQLLRLRGTSVALCPRSNAIIGLDEPPVAAYLEEGNPISVGTDSLASSPSLDLLSDVAMLYKIALKQGYNKEDLAIRLIRSATLGGAYAMGLASGSNRIGQLSVGARANMAFVDLDTISMANFSAEDALHELVSDGAGKVKATLLSGNMKYNSVEDFAGGLYND